MDFDIATDIYSQLQSTKQTDLKDDLIEVAVRYARLRVDWLLADPEKRALLEGDRTACHNAVIVACDILSRNMARQGENLSWRTLLGEDRKRIGDFASYLHCILGLSAR